MLYICNRKKEVHTYNILRGGAEAARWAHNPKVAGSSPAPATKKPVNPAFFIFLTKKNKLKFLYKQKNIYFCT